MEKEKPNLLKTIYDYSCLVFSICCFFVIVISIIVLGVINTVEAKKPVHCSKNCEYSLVETIPTEVELKFIGRKTHEVFIELLQNAKKEVKFFVFYFNLNNSAVEEAKGIHGNDVFNEIIKANKRGVKISMIYNVPRPYDWFYEPTLKHVEYFKQIGIKVHPFDFTEDFGGVLHTKCIIVDNKNFYVGSANTDWKSLSQVKELGLYIKNCGCLANDLGRIFNIFREYLKYETINSAYDTKIHEDKPVKVEFKNDQTGKLFFSASPEPLNSKHRTNDIDALVNVINAAKHSIRVSVMDFLPCSYYENREYWGQIDTALKEAIVRNVTVKLLISNWNHTKAMQNPYLKSLVDFSQICNRKSNYSWCKGKIFAKVFKIPDPKLFKPYIYTRVNHPKYLVSDNKVYVSTSNWAKDYFYDTAGISTVSDHILMRDTLERIHERDYTSIYAKDL